MEYFRLQLGCLAVLLYVAVIYVQGCRRYHYRISASYFWKLLLTGSIACVFDGAVAWAVGNADVIHPVWGYVLHALSFIGLDATIFFLAIYMLVMLDSYPKKNAFLLYIPLGINILLIALTIGLQNYLSGKEEGYTSGPAVIICFVMISLYIMATTMKCFKNFNNFNLIKSEKRRSIITFLFAYAIISVIQMLFAKELSSMSIGITILILGIYLSAEDPAIKELGRYYTETVMSFANLIEERDGSTGGHVKRTHRYVGLILERLRGQEKYKKILTRDYIDNLMDAAPMHDIGKIAIPDNILQKPGKLDDEEYAVMKTHAEIGGKIIMETFGKFMKKDYCDMVYEVARHHHEKWNGRGYPDGLKGEEIPLSARIMAVADVFDAVSEKRCYREALPLSQCFEIIEQGRGTDFDPEVVDAFMKMKSQVEKVHEEMGSSTG